MGEQESNFVAYRYADPLGHDPHTVFTPANLAKLQTRTAHQKALAQRLTDAGYGNLLKGKTLQQKRAILKKFGITDIDNQTIGNILPGDPNDITGPAGFGSAGFIQPGLILPYTVEFQNEPTASAAAQTVVVTQQLDPNLDWSTFQLTSFGFGSFNIAIPAGQLSYSTRVDAMATAGLLVDITATLDTSTGLLTCTFTSIDPNTLAPTTDVDAGFLPPDDSTGKGEGFISYTVQPKAALASGSVINAQANVVFDTNAPIATALWTNTIDAAAPTSTVAVLPASQTTTTFPVAWSGQDDAGGSGLVSYAIYVSTDGGAFTPWIATCAATSCPISGACPDILMPSTAWLPITPAMLKQRLWPRRLPPSCPRSPAPSRSPRATRANSLMPPATR